MLYIVLGSIAVGALLFLGFLFLMVILGAVQGAQDAVTLRHAAEAYQRQRDLWIQERRPSDQEIAHAEAYIDSQLQDLQRRQRARRGID